MTKTFKIGDIVEANEASNGNYSFTTQERGWRGKVSNVYGDKFDAHTIAGRGFDGDEIYEVLNSKYFDLVSAVPEKHSIEIIEGVTVELTPEQLEEVSRKLQEAKKVPVVAVPDIGDWIRAIGDGTGITDGKAYKVVDLLARNYVGVLDDNGIKTVVPQGDYEITDEPKLKVGDWIRIKDYVRYTDVSDKPYKIAEIDEVGCGIFHDDDDYPRNACGKNFEIADKLTPFDRAGREHNEFRFGDVVRATDGGYNEIKEGDIGVIVIGGRDGCPLVRVGNYEYYTFCELVTPVESRVDRAEGGERA